MCDPIEEIGNAVSDVADAVGDVLEGVGDAISSTLDAMMDDPLATIAKIAAVTTGNAWALPYISGAQALADGQDLDKVLGTMAVSYVAGQAGDLAGDYAGATASGAGMDASTIKLLDQMTTSAVRAGVNAELLGGDPLQALIQGGLTAGVPSVLGQIPGFSDLPAYAQRAAASAVSAELTGKDPSAAAISAALSSGINAVARAVNSGEAATYINALVNPDDYGNKALGAEEGSSWDSLQKTLQGIQGGEFDPTKWTQTDDGNFTIAGDNGTSITVDATGKILDTQYGWNPADFPSQDFGASSQQYFDEYQRNLQILNDAGELPTGWVSKDGGAYTYTADDGSTITIGADGNVISSTEAPSANLLSALKSQLPAPVVAAKAAAGSPAAQQQAQQSAQTQQSNDNLLGLLSMLGMMGGQQQAQPQVVQVAPAEVKSFEEQGYGNLFDDELKMAEGGSVADLMTLLRG